MHTKQKYDSGRDKKVIYTSDSSFKVFTGINHYPGDSADCFIQHLSTV